MNSWINAHLVLQGANTWFVVVVCIRSHNTVLMSSGISYVPVFLMINLEKKQKEWVIKHDHVASCWRSQIRCHAPGISHPSTGGDFSLPVWLCTEVGWDLFLPEGNHIPDCSGDTQKRTSGHILEKRDAWGKRRSVQFVEGEVEMKANTHSSPAIMGLLVNRIASGIPFAKHSLGQAPLLAPTP